MPPDGSTPLGAATALSTPPVSRATCRMRAPSLPTRLRPCPAKTRRGRCAPSKGRVRAAEGLDAAFRAEALAAAARARRFAAACGTAGADLPSVLPLLERASCPASARTAPQGGAAGPDAMFLPLSDAAELPACSVSALFVCDLTSQAYPVRAEEDAGALLLERLGLARPRDPLAASRRRFFRALCAARSEVVCERELNTQDAGEAYPAVMLEELLDCYRGASAGPGEDADRATGLPACLVPFARTAGEDALHENLALVSADALAPGAGEEWELSRAGEVVRAERVALPRRATAGAHGAGCDAQRVVLSPSALEAYLECPCKWLASRRLHLSEPDAGFGPAEMGSFSHGVLKSFYERFREAGGRKVSRENVGAARALLGETFDRHLALQPGLDRSRSPLVPLTAVERAEVRELKRTLSSYLDRECDLLPGFAPAHLEFEFGGSEAFSYGGCLLRGSVDRIDVNDRGQAVVIDYKGSLSRDHALAASSPAVQAAGAVLPHRVQALVYAQVARRVLGLDVVGALYGVLRAQGRRVRGVRPRRPRPGRPARHRRGEVRRAGSCVRGRWRRVVLRAGGRGGGGRRARGGFAFARRRRSRSARGAIRAGSARCPLARGGATHEPRRLHAGPARERGARGRPPSRVPRARARARRSRSRSVSPTALLPDSGPAVGGIDEVLAITFTEKAASEIKARVQAHAACGGPRRRGAQGGRRPGYRRSTACARRILRTHALDLGIDPAFRIVGDAERAELLAAAIDAALSEGAVAGGGAYRALFDEYKARSRMPNETSVASMLGGFARQGGGAAQRVGRGGLRAGTGARLGARARASFGLRGGGGGACGRRGQRDGRARPAPRRPTARRRSRRFWPKGRAKEGATRTAGCARSRKTVDAGCARIGGNFAAAVKPAVKAFQAAYDRAVRQIALGLAHPFANALAALAADVHARYEEAKRAACALDNDDLLSARARGP